MGDLANGALITGGASGIGLALAGALAARGLRIVLCDRDEAQLARAAVALEVVGAEVLAIPLDVCDRHAWAEAASAASAFARLTVVCANAGVAPGGAPLSELAPAAWDRIVAINLTGVFNTVHACAPLIKAHGAGGHIVLTASMAGVLAASPIGDYAATKFGVAALGEALRAELAPAGIGVSILCPGVVATPLVGQGAAAGMDPKWVAHRVLEAIDRNEAYIFTHGDYRPLVASRFEAVLSAFGEFAQPGFHEAEGVMAMMTPKV